MMNDWVDQPESGRDRFSLHWLCVCRHAVGTYFQPTCYALFIVDLREGKVCFNAIDLLEAPREEELKELVGKRLSAAIKNWQDVEPLYTIDVTVVEQ